MNNRLNAPYWALRIGLGLGAFLAGLDKFSNELLECVRQYYEATHALGRKLVVRTWGSGSPHWLRDEYVHAPGYGTFGGTEEQL